MCNMYLKKHIFLCTQGFLNNIYGALFCKIVKHISCGVTFSIHTAFDALFRRLVGYFLLALGLLTRVLVFEARGRELLLWMAMG